MTQEELKEKAVDILKTIDIDSQWNEPYLVVCQELKKNRIRFKSECSNKDFRKTCQIILQRDTGILRSYSLCVYNQESAKTTIAEKINNQNICQN